MASQIDVMPETNTASKPRPTVASKPQKCAELAQQERECQITIANLLKLTHKSENYLSKTSEFAINELFQTGKCEGILPESATGQLDEIRATFTKLLGADRVERLRDYSGSATDKYVADKALQRHNTKIRNAALLCSSKQEKAVYWCELPLLKIIDLKNKIFE